MEKVLEGAKASLARVNGELTKHAHEGFIAAVNGATTEQACVRYATYSALASEARVYEMLIKATEVKDES